MSDMKSFKYAVYTLVLAMGWLVLPHLAHAQSYSAGSFNSNRNIAVTNSCASEALELNQRLVEVRQRINQHIRCNRNGQIFDGTDCATPLTSPEHEFLRPEGGATLAFQNVDNDSFATAHVVGGADGVDVECEGEVVPDPDVDPLTCTAPWGDTMDDGDTIYAYRASSVAADAECEGQVRTCSGGVLSGSYRHRNCTVEDPDDDPVDCSLPWGGTLAHGRSTTAYESASVASTSTCNSQTRSCDNGTLSGSFTHQSCTVSEPVTTCRPWQWDYDGWCRGRPQCNNFNILNQACNGDPNCTLRNVNYRVNTCAVCNVEGERCYTR